MLIVTQNVSYFVWGKSIVSNIKAGSTYIKAGSTYIKAGSTYIKAGSTYKQLEYCALNSEGK